MVCVLLGLFVKKILLKATMFILHCSVKTKSKSNTYKEP